MAAAIGSASAAVIIEPDALPDIECPSAEGQALRYSLLDYAVTKLSHNQSAAVYLDAGNSSWKSAEVMAPPMAAAGVAKARRFSVNISGYEWTSTGTDLGNDLARRLGGKHFIMDTSRNGNGPASGDLAWCNPRGRKMGPEFTTNTGSPYADAFFWVRSLGGSDGTCNRNEPPAGTFWIQHALDMARNTGW